MLILFLVPNSQKVSPSVLHCTRIYANSQTMCGLLCTLLITISHSWSWRNYTHLTPRNGVTSINICKVWACIISLASNLHYLSLLIMCSVRISMYFFRQTDGDSWYYSYTTPDIRWSVIGVSHQWLSQLSYGIPGHSSPTQYNIVQTVRDIDPFISHTNNPQPVYSSITLIFMHCEDNFKSVEIYSWRLLLCYHWVMLYLAYLTKTSLTDVT